MMSYFVDQTAVTCIFTWSLVLSAIHLSSLGIRNAQFCTPRGIAFHLAQCITTSTHHPLVCLMQKNSRKVGPEVQSALAKQQAEHTEDLALLQEQLDGLKKTLDQQKAAAQKMEQVRARLLLVLFLSHCCTHCSSKLPFSP